MTSGRKMNEASTAADKHIDRRIVLKAGVALATAGPVILGGGHAEAQPRATALFAYVGAFTTPERKGHGGGINVYRVDPTSGAWTQEQLLEVDNPSFLTVDRAQRFLYSVHADLDEVSAYAIDKQTGHITVLNRQSCGGKNPVHLSIDPTGRWIITANYSAGSVGVVPIEKDGTLGSRSDLVNLSGEPGPDGKRQASSHPHDAVFDPSGRFIAVPDLGFDRIFVFRLDAATGKLTPNDPPFVKNAPGRRSAAHRLSSQDAAGVCDQRTGFERHHLPLRSSARQLAADPDRAVYPAELHRRQSRRRGRRRALRPRGLCLEPWPRQHRCFRRQCRRRDPDPGGLGTDPRQVPALFFASILQPRPSTPPTPTRVSAMSNKPTRSCRSGSTKLTGCLRRLVRSSRQTARARSCSVACSFGSLAPGLGPTTVVRLVGHRGSIMPQSRPSRLYLLVRR